MGSSGWVSLRMHIFVFPIHQVQCVVLILMIVQWLYPTPHICIPCRKKEGTWQKGFAEVVLLGQGGERLPLHQFG